MREPYWQSPDESLSIYNADARDLSMIADGTVQCCITSPPYFGLRDYGVDGQIGLEGSPEEYVANLVNIFREVKRVLRDDGTVWLNLGDSYAGSCMQGGDGSTSTLVGTHHRQHTDSDGFVKRQYPGLKPKDLCMIPARVALALQADGWWVRSRIVWNKKNPMPESTPDRPTSSHEDIYLLAKSGKPTYWTHRNLSGVRKCPKADWRWVHQVTGEELLEAPPDWKEIIQCPVCAGTGEAQVDIGYEFDGQWIDLWQLAKCEACNGKGKTQLYKRVNLWRGHGYFYDADAIKEPLSPLTIKVHSGYKTTRPHAVTGQSHKAKAARVAPSDGIKNGPGMLNPSGRNKRNVWTVATQPFPGSHFAVFPEKLIEPCVLAGSPAQSCAECGAAWERVVEKESRPSVEAERHKPNTAAAFGGRDQSIHVTQSVLKSQTLGFRPTCTCNAGTLPSIILDPFGGAGTTTVVAAKHGRRAIMVELSEEYCEMAKQRIEKATAQLRLELEHD